MGMIAWNPFPIDPIHDLSNGMPVCVWKRTIPSFEITLNTPFCHLEIPADLDIVSFKHIMNKVIPVFLAQDFIGFPIFFRGR